MEERSLKGPISKRARSDELSGTARLQELEECLSRLQAIGRMMQSEAFVDWREELLETAHLGQDLLYRHDLHSEEGQRAVIAELRWKRDLLALARDVEVGLHQIADAARTEYQNVAASLQEQGSY